MHANYAKSATYKVENMVIVAVISCSGSRGFRNDSQLLEFFLKLWRKSTRVLGEKGLQQTYRKGAYGHMVTHLYPLVLLCCEFLSADGGDGDVSSQQRRMLRQEREGIHPTERRADHHHWSQAQLLTHLLQKTCGGQFPHRCRRLGRLGPTESCRQMDKEEINLSSR